MSYASVSYPVWTKNDGTGLGTWVSTTVEQGCTLASASNQLTLVPSVTPGTIIAAVASTGTDAPHQIADGEIALTMRTPTVSAGTDYPRGGPACRFSTSGSDMTGYFIRETTKGDSSSWELMYMTDNSPAAASTILAAMAPAGLSASYGSAGIAIRWRFVGSAHQIKIWEASAAEPAWTDSTYVFTVTDSSKTTTGMTGFFNGGGTVGTAPKTICEDIAIYQFNKLQAYEAAPQATTAAGGATNSVATTTALGDDGTPMTCALGCYANEVILIVISHDKATSINSVTSVTCSDANLTISSQLIEVGCNTIATPARRLTVYSALATADISAATVTVKTGSPAVDQDGNNISILRLNGALRGTDGSTSVANANSASTDSTVTVTPAVGITYVNPVATSGAVIASFHNDNEATTVEAGWTLGHSVSHTNNLNSLGTAWRADNDTTPTMTWVGGDRAMAWAAEVKLNDAPVDATSSAAGLTPRHYPRGEMRGTLRGVA